MLLVSVIDSFSFMQLTNTKKGRCYRYDNRDESSFDGFLSTLLLYSSKEASIVTCEAAARVHQLDHPVSSI